MFAAIASTVTTFVRRLRGDDRGASLVEYALLIALIAIVCFGAITYFGTSTGGSLDTSKACMEAAYDGTPKPADCPD